MIQGAKHRIQDPGTTQNAHYPMLRPNKILLNLIVIIFYKYMLHMTCIICYTTEVDVIKSFRDKETEKIYRGYKSLKLDQSIQRLAYRKLKMINNAFDLKDLTAPPSNNLEKLKGKMEGYYSIRINDQFRICFRWENQDVYDVEIVDYH
jgi:proteic killer suppression protein